MEQISHITNFMSDEASTVRKATVDEAAPTPGYLYNELIVLCQKSSASSALLVDLLVKRLNTGVSTHPKYKALNCMKHLAQKGPADFAEVLRQKIDIIRSYKNYRAEPDPVKGDAYNNMVRIAAQAVEEILSSEQTFKRPLSSSTIATQSISSGLSDGDASFGAAAWEKVKSIVPSIGSKGAVEAGDSRQEGSATSSRWSFSGAVDFISSIRRTKTDDTTYTTPDSSTTNTSARTPEERLIDAAILNPGTRVTPPAESIKLFNTYSESLNKKKLARLLLRTLENPDWQVRLKCLYYIDGLLKYEEKTYKPIFSRSSDYIEDTLQTPQASVRDKAKKVMKRLSRESEASEDENDSSDEEGKSKQVKKKTVKPHKESPSESEGSGDSDEGDDSDLSDFYKEGDTTESSSEESGKSEEERHRKPKKAPQKPSVKFASPDESDESEENTKRQENLKKKGKGKAIYPSDDSEDEKKLASPPKKTGKGKAAPKKTSSSEESSEEERITKPVSKSKGKIQPTLKSKTKKEPSSDEEEEERVRSRKPKSKPKAASRAKDESSSDSSDEGGDDSEEDKGKKQSARSKAKNQTKQAQPLKPKAKAKTKAKKESSSDDDEDQEKVEVKPRPKSKSTSSIDTKKAAKDTAPSSKGKHAKETTKKSAAPGDPLDELFGETPTTNSTHSPQRAAISNDADSLLSPTPQQRNAPPPGARVSSVVLNPHAPVHPNYSVNAGHMPVGMGQIQPGALVPYGMQMQGMMQPGMSPYPNAYSNTYPYPGMNQGAFRPNPY